MLIAIAALAFLLRSYPLRDSLWIDELHTAWVVAGDNSELVDRAHLGNNSAAYFLLVRGVCRVLGLHEWSLRLISLVSGCVLVPATYYVARSWNCSSVTSLLAAGLVALDPHAVYFSGEARTYGLIQLIALIHLALFVRLLVQTNHAWTWAAWTLSGIGLFHLHCTTALVFAAEIIAVVVLLIAGSKLKTNWFYLMLGLVVITIGMIPSVDLLRQVAARRGNWAKFVQQQSPLAMFTIYPLWVYTLLPLVAASMLRLARFARITSLAKRGRGALDGTDSERDRDQQAVRPLGENAADQTRDPDSVAAWIPMVTSVVWLCVPIVVAWTLTELDVARVFFRRYLIAASVALAPLAAQILNVLCRTREHERWLTWAVLGAALFGISPISQIRFGAPLWSHSTEDWRTPIAVIRDAESQLPVFLYSGLIEVDDWYGSPDPLRREYCELPVRGIYRLEPSQEVIPLPRSEPRIRDDQRARLPQRAWLLVRGGSEIANRVEQQLLRVLGDPWMVESRTQYGRVRLVRLARGTTGEA